MLHTVSHVLRGVLHTSRVDGVAHDDVLVVMSYSSTDHFVLLVSCLVACYFTTLHTMNHFVQFLHNSASPYDVRCTTSTTV